MKKKLGEPPVLVVPDFTKGFVVQTNASNIGIGAVLTQKGANDEHCVAFASHKLRPQEQNYSVEEKRVPSHCVGSTVLPLPLWPTLRGRD